MTIPTNAFHLYVERARDGRTALWRVLLGAVLAVVLSQGFAVVAFGTIAVVITIGMVRRAGAPVDAAQVQQALSAFMLTPTGGAFQLAAIAAGWGCIWLIVRLLHRRPLSGVLGAGGRLAWRDFRRAVGVTLVVGVATEAAMLLIDPSLHRSAIGIDVWLLWALPLAALTFAQASAEELVFRGYMLQSLAARFRSPLVWGLLPNMIFVLLHWDPNAGGLMNAIILASVAIFALGALWLTHATGNLAAAMGLHFGNNILPILFVSHGRRFRGVALFAVRPLDSPGWGPGDAIGILLICTAAMALTLWLLLHPRSPLRLARGREAVALA